MFCTKCGARIRATAECCGHCGLQRFHVSDAELPTTISHATLDAVNSGPRLESIRAEYRFDRVRALRVL